MKENNFKHIEIARLISKYMYFIFTSIFTITILFGVLYLNSHYQYPMICNTCACPGCSPLLSLEYEQNKLLFFRTIYPWIVSSNLIIIIMTIMLERLFKNLLLKRILQNANLINNQFNIDNLHKLKYKLDIKNYRDIKARLYYKSFKSII